MDQFDAQMLAMLGRVEPRLLGLLRRAHELREETKGSFDIGGFEIVGDTVRVTQGDLDLGGIGKGYAIDRVVEQLKARGIESALVHGGTSTVYALGTPPGVGHARRPPVWMEPGDVVEVEIEGIGLCRNPIVAESDPAMTEAAE